MTNAMAVSGTAPVCQRRLIQGVEYYHLTTAQGGDLFLTRFGLPWAEHLSPENFLDPPWFKAHRVRLRGTSTIYRSQTKLVRGRSLKLIVRYNRMGEDLPVDTMTRNCHAQAAFNSPFEEIANLMDLRSARFGPQRCMIPTKRPLAIYSPPERLELWQTGRSESQIAAKQARLPDYPLDIHRPYLVVYEWIKGMDVLEAANHLGLEGSSRAAFLTRAMDEVERELSMAGFGVLDMKPAHIIVRLTAEGQLLRRPDGRLVYALVDYELLERLESSSGSSMAALNQNTRHWYAEK